MNFDLENELNANLAPREKFLWTGQPKTGIVFRPADIFLIPFSLIWFGAVIGGLIFEGISRGPIMFFSIWWLFFFGAGFYMAIGRFIVDVRMRKKTVYGITDQRVIIKSGLFQQTTSSLNIKTISDVTLREKKDGTGTITLGPSDPRYAMYGNVMPWAGRRYPPSLELIGDARKVYDLLLGLQR